MHHISHEPRDFPEYSFDVTSEADKTRRVDISDEYGIDLGYALYRRDGGSVYLDYYEKEDGVCDFLDSLLWYFRENLGIESIFGQLGFVNADAFLGKR